jgi:hypothetical protein
MVTKMAALVVMSLVLFNGIGLSGVRHLVQALGYLVNGYVFESVFGIQKVLILLVLGINFAYGFSLTNL